MKRVNVVMETGVSGFRYYMGFEGFIPLKKVQDMDLIQIRKEIEEKARSHRKPVIPPVLAQEFEGLSGREFLEKAYCRLLGRMPGAEEKEHLYLRFYSGDVSKWELLEGLASSEECARYDVDVSDVLTGCRKLKEKEEKKGRIGRILPSLKYLFRHKTAWRRLERIQEIWKQEDEI